MTAETLSQRILTSKQRNQKKEEDRGGLGNQDQITNDLFPDCTLRSTAQNNTKHHNDPKIETLKIFFIGVPSCIAMECIAMENTAIPLGKYYSPYLAEVEGEVSSS